MTRSTKSRKGGKPPSDLTGQRFGRLTVVRRATPTPSGKTRWECLCDCGEQTVVQTSCLRLRKRPTRSCGCLRALHNTARRQDLRGRRVGRLLVLAFAGAKSSKIQLWLCLCDCGRRVTVDGTRLRARTTVGQTRSCGCLRQDSARANRFKHGMTNTPEGAAWRSMRDRCNRNNCWAFPYYGGRGIKVCRGWSGEDGFLNFYRDMGPKPSPRYTLDRRDNDHGYDCGKCEDCRARHAIPNCRWATRAEQSRNRRSNRFYTIDTERLCLSEWAARYGLTPTMLKRRLAGGMEIEEAIKDALLYLKS